MDKQDIQHWNGEGLPPVGAVCELYDCEAWNQVLIKFIGEKYVVVQDERFSVERVYCAADKPNKFRPIRTPEQIEAERRSKVIASLSQLIVNKCHSDVAALDIYDAIRSGKIEGVKIDG